MSNLLENSTAVSDAELQMLLEQARRACSTTGALSSECAAAWDAIEEIHAAHAHQRALQKTNFERYCEERPDALEARIYDV